MARILTAILLALAFGAAVRADEILLKDGKKIEWTSIKDQGDSYEVETAHGKVVVRKADIDRVTTVLGSEPLTGATFSFEKKRKLTVTNLLLGLDMKKASFQGNWALKGTELSGVCGGDANARLFFPVPVPDEYDLTLEVARKSGDGDFDIGLVAGGKQGVLGLDAANCTLSGFMLDGKPLDGVTNGTLGRFFTNGQARTIVCMVRKTGIVVAVDGKDFAVLPPEWGRLSVHPAHAVPSRDSLFLVCWRGTYSITKAVLSTPKAAP